MEKGSKKGVITVVAVACYLLGLYIARWTSDEISYHDSMIEYGFETRADIFHLYLLLSLAILLLLFATALLVYRDRLAARMTRADGFQDRVRPSSISANPRTWEKQEARGATARPGSTAPVKRVCPRCGTANPAFAQFCVGCSTPLQPKRR